MKAPVIYVVINRGEFSTSLLAWAFDKTEAENRCAELNRAGTNEYAHQVEEVESLDPAPIPDRW